MSDHRDASRLDRLGTEAFDEFAGILDYPMFIVTTTDGIEPSGCLVGFATQVSIDPPRMVVCISGRNHTYGIARRADVIAVHAIRHDQHELAALFGEWTGDRTDKFARCGWHEGPGGVPLLDDAPRLMVGRIRAQWPFGDHVGFLLDPIAVKSQDGGAADGPLLTLRDVDDLAAGHSS